MGFYAYAVVQIYGTLKYELAGSKHARYNKKINNERSILY